MHITISPANPADGLQPPLIIIVEAAKILKQILGRDAEKSDLIKGARIWLKFVFRRMDTRESRRIANKPLERIARAPADIDVSGGID